MKARHLLVGMTCASLLGAAVLTGTAQAQDTIYVPLLTYRTGPFAGSGIPIANGMHDYLAMLNERDGGIGGVKLNVEECETGYDTKKGVECWESVKGKKPAVVNPYSTGITLQIIPKAAVDKIPILSMAYGLSASAIGEKFPWIFNPPATYWDGLSMIMRYIGGKEGGLDKLKGKTIGFIFLESGYGREPLPLLQEFAKDYGFTVKEYSVAGKEMQDQSAQWLAVRRDRPAWMIMWGWGAMNPTAVKRAREWLSDGSPCRHLVVRLDDGRGGGEAAAICPLFNGLTPTTRPSMTSEICRGQGQEPVEKDKFDPTTVASTTRCWSRKRTATPKLSQEGRGRRGPPRSRNAQHQRRTLEGARLTGFARRSRRELLGPQRPWLGLHAAVGRHQVGQGFRLDPAHEGQGTSAARCGRHRICREEHRLAEAD
jgi:branched-chain amino acid transport system substrate-binding protein